ncbi:SPOR domain-containing protein [Paenibacillus sp. FA6]|uniref:SPOR domain-containing protein n=1 Tax=Paenibacillus sp. FA6 TaxID=3413029 RepID=UPI003F65FCE0
MNKGRMTFRFDEGKRNTEWNEQIINGEKAVEKLVESEFRDELKNETYPRLTVVPEPLEGWGDPFSKNEAWEEMMTNRQQRVDFKDNEYDELYSTEAQHEGKVSPDINNSHSEYRKHRPTSLWKIFGTVTAAVVTGALFGFVVLSFIDLGSIFPKESSTITDTEAISVTSLVPTASEGEIPAVAVTIEPQTYYMLQYGVFSNAERVEIAKKELEQIGLAAGDDPDQENRVYAGISTDREQAKLLSNQLKTQGVELYVREIILPSASELTFAGDAQSVNDYFTVSTNLISSLSNQSSVLLGMERPTPLSHSDTVALTELHRVWTESIKTLQAGLTSEESAGVKQMELAMNSALSSVVEYNKNTSKGHLWEIQSFMMQYMMGQKQVLEMMMKS